MEKIKKVLHNDKFAEYNGIELLDIGEGKALVKMEISEYHLNGVGITHGGALFTLADYAFAAASNSYGTVAVAINANISYMKATSQGILMAEAQEVSKNPKLATYTVRITDETGDLVAIFQGMAYRKRDKIE
jgi:acyl-CoA thioesterase